MTLVKSNEYELLERFISAELTGRRHPGSSVSLIKGKDVVWSRGFGYSNIKEKTPVTPDTVFGCASVTKPVVTVGFLQLMEKGKFILDDRVNTHLDVKIKDIKGEEPTIRDLLTHYSGMPTRVPPLYLLGEQPLNMRVYLEAAARMVRPRGETWAYCNTAFTIIGYLIRTFTDQNYDVYLKKHVLEPLEMNSSDFELTSLIINKLAQGYKRAGGSEKPLIPNSKYILGMEPADPAGSLYSSVLDLAKFVAMNMNGGLYNGKRILREETLNEMQKLQAPTGNSQSGMGLAWFRTIHDGHVMLYHTGGLPDFTNHVCFYPEEKIGVCWLSNLQDGSGWRPPAPTALRIASGESSNIRPILQSIPSNWKNIIGVYGDNTRLTNLRVINGFLTFNEILFLERIDDYRYIVHGPVNDGEELTLEYGEDGCVTQINLGTSFYRRFKPETIRVDISADLIGTWVGEYHDAYGFHKFELRIINSKNATATNPRGEFVEITAFQAELGQVKGNSSFRIPTEYARWGTQDFMEVRIDLKAVNGKLVGLLKAEDNISNLELEKKAP